MLFPGALGLLLTAVAVLKGGALRDSRARMCFAIGVAGVALSFGSQMPGYSVLYDAMPLLRGIRATARFGILATLAVAVLAAYGVVALRKMMPMRAWPSVSVVLITCASLESLAAPLGLTRFDGIPPIYAQVPRTPGTVVLEVPFFGPRSVQFHAHYMLDSTVNWQPLVNGYSGFQPPSFYENARALQNFPYGGSVTRARALGVTHVFLLRPDARRRPGGNGRTRRRRAHWLVRRDRAVSPEAAALTVRAVQLTRAGAGVAANTAGPAAAGRDDRQISSAVHPTAAGHQFASSGALPPWRMARMKKVLSVMTAVVLTVASVAGYRALPPSATAPGAT